MDYLLVTFLAVNRVKTFAVYGRVRDRGVRKYQYTYM